MVKKELKSNQDNCTTNNKDLNQKLNNEIDQNSNQYINEDSTEDIYQYLNQDANKHDFIIKELDSIQYNFYKLFYLKGVDRPIIWRIISRFPFIYNLSKINKTGIKKAFINFKAYKSIKKNELLDIGYYLKKNPDVYYSGQDPILHYIYHGFNEGRLASLYFDGNKYLSENPDVKKANLNPLVHYSLYGLKEDRGILNGSKHLVVYNQNNGAYKHILNLFENSYNKSSDFVDYRDNDFDLNDNDVKLISFYLPQFHPFKENDEWWGKGFTEWSNVTRALPMFHGHNQPQLPIDTGFYDLRLVETFKKQISLAKNYGIFGFCFYFYWFNGKKLMEKPVELFLENKEDLNFPFCICWANENWTRCWDGQEDDILISQKYSKDSDLEIIKDFHKFLIDDRYIKINNKPVVLIYKLFDLPNPKITFDIWRKYCRDEGIGEIYLIGVRRQEFISSPKEYGLDAAVEFPPNYPRPTEKVDVEYVHPDYKPTVYSMDKFINEKRFMETEDEYKKFKAVFPAWDNTARRLSNGQVYLSSPELYERWLKESLIYTKNNFDEKEQFVFINAWNEWAEGAHLEPDQTYGYSYLESTLNAIKYTRNIDMNILEDNFKVSIIMPTYNRKNIIKRAIGSVLNQTFTNYELIICDDGSDDGSDELIQSEYCDEIQSSKITYINQKNKGVSSARNKALSLAEGNLIAYLDSDNFWLEDYLKNMVNVFYLDDCDSAYCSMEVNDGHINPIYGRNKFIRSEKFNRKKLLDKNFIDLNTYMHKKDLYTLKGGFNESLNSMVDWELILRYTENNEPKFLNEILVKYYLDSNLDNITYKTNHDEDYKKIKELYSIKENSQ